MRLKLFLNENIIICEGINFQNLLKKVGNKSTNTLKNFFKENWIKLTTIIKKQNVEIDVLYIINKELGMNYKDLDDISKYVLKEENINEDFKHYWELVKQEAFPSLAFWPIFKIWLEIDKIIGNTGDASFKTIAIYGLFWVFLISGKHIKSFMDWKKKNPNEYKKEGSKKNPFGI